MKKAFTNYNPLYFLAALGMGGLTTSFFMYFMFMVPHPETPMPTFEVIFSQISAENLWVSALILLAAGAMLFFAFKHFQLLIWNIRQFFMFKKTEAYQKLKESNAEVSLMAIPLTLAMSVNVLFVLGAAFVPNLWSVIDSLLPGALVVFLAIGALAIKIYAKYFVRILIKGDFNFQQNDNLSQMIAFFAFLMISVGLAAPAGMSQNIPISVTAMFFSLFFASMAALLGLVKLILGFKSIFRYGVAKEASPTLWILIPMLTLVGITFVRLYSGISHNFLHTDPSPLVMLVVLTIFVSLQIVTGLIGYLVLKKIGYFAEYVNGPKKHVGSFTLICPGVAAFVLGMFFVGWGLVKTQIVTMYSPAYFIILAPLVFIQIKTIQTIFKLNKKHFKMNKAKENLEIQKVS